MFKAALSALLASSRIRPSSLLVALLTALIASFARGDAASGTYTGSVALRGNYWWEKSTRVVAPSTSVSVASPSGVRIDGSYLLDAITSASQATGVVDDAAFTERRHEGHLGLGYELDLGTRQIDLAVSGRYSREPDYVSRGVGFAAALSLDQRNTVFHLNGYFVHDDISRKERFIPSGSSGGLMARRAVPVGDLQVLSFGLSLDQVLSRTTTLTLGYDLSWLEGFQANPYRLVRIADGGVSPERHPDQRFRHAGYLWLARYVPRTRTTLRAGYRLYYDSWGLLAHSPDVRLHQELGRHLELRLRYRYYTQRPPFFYRAGGNVRADEYRTADPKMTDFHDQTLGFKMRLSLDFLGFTKLDLLRTAVLDWGVEYVFNTNRYGDGIVAQGGLGWAF